MRTFPPRELRRGQGRFRRHPVRTAAAGGVLVVVLVSGLHFEQYTGVPAAGEDCAIRAHLATATGPGAPSALRKWEHVERYPRWLTQVRGTVDDASCLNTTPVYGVARPTSISEVRQALRFARATI